MTKPVFTPAEIEGIDVRLEPMRVSDSPIKYTVAMGAPIRRDGDMKSTIPFDCLAVGQMIVCPWLFGYAAATVTKIDGEKAEADGAMMVHSLHFCKDRKCWVSSFSGAKVRRTGTYALKEILEG